MFHFGVSASEVTTCHRPPSALSARRKKARHAPVRHCLVPLASRHNRDSPSTAAARPSGRCQWGTMVLPSCLAVIGMPPLPAAPPAVRRGPVRLEAPGPGGQQPRQWPGRRPSLRSAQWPPQAHQAPSSVRMRFCIGHVWQLGPGIARLALNSEHTAERSGFVRQLPSGAWRASHWACTSICADLGCLVLCAQA